MKRSNTILYIKLVQENDYAEVYGHYLVKGVTIDEFQKKITAIKESLTNENSKDFNDAWELEDVFKILPKEWSIEEISNPSVIFDIGGYFDTVDL